MEFHLLKITKKILLVFTIFIVSCSNNENIDIVEKEKFINILTDLHITDAILANKGWYDGKLIDTTRSYYNYILKKYDISRAEFDYSLVYYSQDPEEYNRMYDEVIAKLNEKIPRQLHEHSIYKIIELALNDAEIKHDLNNYYGLNGKELWKGRRAFKLPEDTVNVYTEIQDSFKYQCLAVLKAEFLVLPKDSNQNLTMELVINYKDTTIETVKNDISGKDGKWKSYKLILKTDSTKNPVSMKASILNKNSEKDTFRLQLKNISLKQYAPNKDTSLVDSIIKVNKINEIPFRKKGEKRPIFKNPD